MSNNQIKSLTIDGITYYIVDETSGFSKISIDRKTTSGTNIADITIDGTTTELYAPTGGGSTGTVTSVGVSNATNGGLSVSGSPITSSGSISIGHSNVLSSAQTTQAIYPIKIDKNGHVSQYGSAFNLKSEVLNMFYPVGSYYETSNTSFDPNTAWGGTWVLETAGKFHLSAGTGYTAGSTGGSADAIVPYHRHSVAKVTDAITGGAHTHDIANRSVYGGSSNYTALFKGGTGTSTNAALSETHTHDLPAHNTDYEGTSGTGANMPPYIAVNRWHRTA